MSEIERRVEYLVARADGGPVPGGFITDESDAARIFGSAEIAAGTMADVQRGMHPGVEIFVGRRVVVIETGDWVDATETAGAAAERDAVKRAHGG